MALHVESRQTLSFDTASIVTEQSSSSESTNGESQDVAQSLKERKSVPFEPTLKQSRLDDMDRSQNGATVYLDRTVLSSSSNGPESTNDDHNSRLQAADDMLRNTSTTTTDSQANNANLDSTIDGEAAKTSAKWPSTLHFKRKKRKVSIGQKALYQRRKNKALKLLKMQNEEAAEVEPQPSAMDTTDLEDCVDAGEATTDGAPAKRGRKRKHGRKSIDSVVRERKIRSKQKKQKLLEEKLASGEIAPPRVDGRGRWKRTGKEKKKGSKKQKQQTVTPAESRTAPDASTGLPKRKYQKRFEYKPTKFSKRQIALQESKAEKARQEDPSKQPTQKRKYARRESNVTPNPTWPASPPNKIRRVSRAVMKFPSIVPMKDKLIPTPRNARSLTQARQAIQNLPVQFVTPVQPMVSSIAPQYITVVSNYNPPPVNPAPPTLPSYFLPVIDVATDYVSMCQQQNRPTIVAPSYYIVPQPGASTTSQMFSPTTTVREVIMGPRHRPRPSPKKKPVEVVDLTLDSDSDEPPSFTSNGFPSLLPRQSGTTLPTQLRVNGISLSTPSEPSTPRIVSSPSSTSTSAQGLLSDEAMQKALKVLQHKQNKTAKFALYRESHRRMTRFIKYGSYYLTYEWISHWIASMLYLSVARALATL